VDDDGRFISPVSPNALKFERFIFDLLPHANRALVVEYAEEEVFAPLKNAPGAERDTAEHVQRFMVNQHRRWLESAGVQVAPGIAVEISPLFALDAQAVAQRIEPGMVIDEPIYLRDMP
jgi:UDP-N-acetylglucosamine/UDP-N-acetylgalactosamine diphosphorylase